jgi:hypothetical protein
MEAMVVGVGDIVNEFSMKIDKTDERATNK